MPCLLFKNGIFEIYIMVFCFLIKKGMKWSSELQKKRTFDKNSVL
ncbi:MAG: hypothetical protein RL329_3748 [Bacteroidota bacterium]|jgi:hypothetical protein